MKAGTVSFILMIVADWICVRGRRVAIFDARPRQESVECDIVIVIAANPKCPK